MCTSRVGLSSHPVLPLARASVCVWRYFDEIGSSFQPLIFTESVVRTIDAHAGACCHDSAYTLSMATRSVRCVDMVDSKHPLPAAAHLRLGEAYRPHLPLPCGLCGFIYGRGNHLCPPLTRPPCTLPLCSSFWCHWSAQVPPPTMWSKDGPLPRWWCVTSWHARRSRAPVKGW